METWADDIYEKTQVRCEEVETKGTAARGKEQTIETLHGMFVPVTIGNHIQKKMPNFCAVVE